MNATNEGSILVTGAAGAPPLGASGLPVAQGFVRWFDYRAGYGMIARDDKNEDDLFHFTTIPGEGYRTLKSARPRVLR